MSDSEVSGRLYSVGMGASGLPGVEQEPGQPTGWTLSASRERPEDTWPAARAQQHRRALRVIQGNPEEYRRLTARQEVIQGELGEAGEEISNLNIRLSELGKLLDGWSDWVVLVGLETQLREMPEIEQFPESPIERLEAIEDRVRQATEDRDEADRDLRRLSEAAAAAIPGEKLLDDEERIEAIRRGRGSFDDSVHDLPERQDELLEMEDVLSDSVRDLGGGLDETGLDGLDTSLAARQRVEAWREELTESSADADAAAVRLEQATGLLEEMKTEEQQARGRLQVDPDAAGSGGLHPASGRLDDLLDDREDMERVRRGRGSFDDSVRDLPERRAELSSQETDISRQLRDLGQGWDESRLDDFDTSMVFRQQVDGYRQGLTEQSARARSSVEQLERERTELVERRAAVEQAQARVPVEQPILDGPEIDLRRSALRTARSRLNDHGRASLNLENLRGQLALLTSGADTADASPASSSILLPAIFVVLAGVLLLAGVYLGYSVLQFGTFESLMLGIVSGALMLVAAYQ